MSAPLSPLGEFAPQSLVAHYATKRNRTDLWATIAYCALSLVVFVIGLFAFSHADMETPEFYQFWASSLTCDSDAFSDQWPVYYSNVTAGNVTTAQLDDFSKAFGKTISVWLPITAVGGIGMSVVYVLVFRRFAEAMTFISIAAAVAASGVFTVLSFLAGAVPAGIILLIVTLAMAGLFWFMRGSLKQCARLLTVSGQGLTDNGWLIPATISVKIGGVGIMLYYIASIIAAFNVGYVTPSPYVAAKTPVLSSDPNVASQIGTCTDIQGLPTNCCQWNTKPWVNPFLVLAFIAVSWTTQLLMQIKLSLVANVIGQWYYHTPGTWSSSEGSQAVRVAMRHTFVENFGSLSFAALILMLLRMLRQALQRSARNNIFACVINCIAQPILALCEKFTRFATIGVAITGQPFVSSACSLFDILKRNFLQTYHLWWVPDLVTSMVVFLFSLAWAGLVFFTTWLGNKNKVSGGDLVSVSFAVSAVCLFVMVVILSYAAGILLDIINTVYICFALDRDSKVVTRPDIHTIYEGLPTIHGAVIEQPDGGIEYGRPDGNNGTLPQAYSSAGAAAPPTQPLFSAPYGYSAVVAHGVPAAPGPSAYPTYPPPAYPPAATYPPVGTYPPPTTEYVYNPQPQYPPPK